MQIYKLTFFPGLNIFYFTSKEKAEAYQDYYFNLFGQKHFTQIEIKSIDLDPTAPTPAPTTTTTLAPLYFSAVFLTLNRTETLLACFSTRDEAKDFCAKLALQDYKIRELEVHHDV